MFNCCFVKRKKRNLSICTVHYENQGEDKQRGYLKFILTWFGGTKLGVELGVNFRE